MSNPRYIPVYVGLRPLYDDGQYYSVEEHRDGTMTVRIHDEFRRCPRARRPNAMR